MNPRVIKLVIAFSAFVAIPAGAAEATRSAPCAVVESANADAQILDRDRKQAFDVEQGKAVSCGGWISVNSGWVKLTHRNGYRIQLSPQTFVNFPETDGSKAGVDHLVIYKGEIFAAAGGGRGEMRVATANARARVARGRVIVNFNHGNDESQLIALDGQATIENRFASNEQVLVKEGEASSLNVSLNRVVPSLPSAVSVSDLRPKMMALHLAESEQTEAVEAVTSRRERKFASLPTGANERTPADAEHAKHHKSKLARRIASSSDYLRHQPNAQDKQLQSELAKKLVGGENAGTEILFPNRYYGKTQKVQILIEDPEEKLKSKQRRQTDAEKRRLIQELSQIRIE